MDISFFRRGIRLGRRGAFGSATELPSPKRVVLLPGHELGETYKQLVKAKDTVTAGAPVAVTEEGHTLHAPISGEVKTLSEVLVADGRRVPAIAIEAGDSTGDENPAEETKLDLKQQVRQSGVIQSGVSARPAADLIEEARDAKVETLAIRFFDPDPYMGCLEAVTAGTDGNVDALKAGVEIVKELQGATKVHFVLEKEQAAAAVEKVAAGVSAEVHRVDAYDYPAMSDALIARKVTGSENDIDPSAVHQSAVLVLDVDTVLDVAAARQGKGVTEKVVTLFGPDVAKAFRVKVGTSIGEILDGAGVGRDFAKVILGGPLTGGACHDLDYPLTKDIGGITLHRPEDVAGATDDQCINCGLCTSTCPMRLEPGILSRYCEYDDFESAEEAHLFSCIECGCCAYVCPAGRSMVQLFSHGKKEFLAGKES